MRDAEHLVQAAFIEWCRLHPLARWALAVPNGGARSKAEAGRLKADGVLAGAWDVFLPVPWHGMPGMWIEFKAGAGRLSPDQRAFGAHIEAQGYGCVVVWDDPELAIMAVQLYFEGKLGTGVRYLR